MSLKACHGETYENVTNCNNSERFNISGFELSKVLYTCGLFGKIKLTAGSKLVLWAFCTYYNPKNKTMFPSQATLAKHLGVSEKTIERAVKELSERGLVVYETHGVNHYGFSAKFWFMTGVRPSLGGANTCGADKMSVQNSQNVGCTLRQNVGQTYKNEKKEKLNFLFREGEVENAPQERKEDIMRSYEQENAVENGNLSAKSVDLSAAEQKKFVENLCGKGFEGNATGKYRKITEDYAKKYQKIPQNQYYSACQPQEAPNRTIPSISETKSLFRELDAAKKAHEQAVLPIDYTREHAYQWIKGLHPRTRSALKSVRALCEKWGFTEFEL